MQLTRVLREGFIAGLIGAAAVAALVPGRRP